MRLTMKCGSCHREVGTVKNVIRQGKILTGCDNCLSNLTQGNVLSAKYNRDRMREDYRKDIVQKSDPRAYAKAYPEKAREHFGDEQFRKLV